MTQGVNRFRTSFTFMEGDVPALFVQGKIVNVNLVNWTVDVVSQFDRKRYFDIQVGTPYVHYSNGEGQSIFPEVGAKCMVCIPSDSSPPYVSSFIMPVEVTDLAAPDAPKGITSQPTSGATSSGASFAGGRPKAKPGDIWLRTRDDNFVILHRGGVLQIGATELAQRIYIPLKHHIMDVSQNYIHHNAGGSSFWGLQEGPGLDHLPTEHWQTFRVYADNKFADIRIKTGKVSDPFTEPSGDDGNQPDIEELSLGKGDGYIVTEVIIAPDGFNPESGSPASSDTYKQTVMRFFFDRAGGVFFRCKGGMLLATKKRLLVRADEGIDIKSKKDFTVTATTGTTINGGPFTHIKGDVVRLGPGAKPVALQGSMVQGTIPPLPVIGQTADGTPVTGNTVPTIMFSFVSSGSPTVLA